MGASISIYSRDMLHSIRQDIAKIQFIPIAAQNAGRTLPPFCRRLIRRSAVNLKGRKLFEDLSSVSTEIHLLFFLL